MCLARLRLAEIQARKMKHFEALDLSPRPLTPPVARNQSLDAIKSFLLVMARQRHRDHFLTLSLYSSARPTQIPAQQRAWAFGALCGPD